MKLSKWTFRLLLLGIISAMTFTSCSSDDDGGDPIVDDDPIGDEDINIPNAVLRTYIKDELGIADTDPITPEDMLLLTEINTADLINANEIDDLTGLEYAENVTYLRLSGVGALDLSPVSDLEHVEYFRINDTHITDLSPIAGYTGLTYFNANTNTSLVDISPLAGNTGLKEIILRSVPMGNAGLQTIANFTELYRINMRNTGVTDLTIIGDMMANGALQDDTPGAQQAQGGAVIDVRDLEGVIDWRPIADYVENINDYSGPTFVVNPIPDSDLVDAVKTTLELGAESELNSLHVLSLLELDVDGNASITSIEGLEHARNLTYLHIGETGVTDLSPISDLTKVEYLRLNQTDITDLSPIINYTSLTYFNANRTTGITDISPLAGNTGLQTVILREVPFGNAGMATIANFNAMYRINMRATEVTDITVLGDLMADGALLDSTPGAAENGGADLDLRDLDIEDWSPIEPYLDQITTLEGYDG